ncbi:MAG: NAD(P)/FAD-dependent oxidoreductase [Deltaproteobacteria bacterium]|nr:NAD(P)/FAD-dependent oxidoreductase [Deltaproteobacteria bacterium]
MTTPDWDILVVGAGPAGSSAALAAARQGAHVLLVERRQQVGLPVQCAEYIPAMLKGQLGLKGGYVVQKIEGMRTHMPGQAVKETVAPGYIIRRELFDQALVAAARKAGARVRCATRAIAMRPEGDVTLSPRDGRAYTVRPKVIIGADGPRSTIGRWAGVVNRHLLPGVQMTLPLAAPLACTEIYFDPQIVAGYGWLFPKGKVANVGLGMLRPSGGQLSLRKVLDGFIRRLKTDGKICGAPLAHTTGWIPAEPVRNAVHGKIMLAGDAAGHTHPITGAGIFAAVTCGKLAGKYAAAAVAASDMTILKAYDREWQDLLGETQTRAHCRREQMEACWNVFDTIIKQCWVAYREYYV